MGPFPQGHHPGMLQAIMVVMRSMEPWKGKGCTVKYGTSCKSRGTFTILWDASPDAGADIALSSSSVKARFVATWNPSEGRWYQRLRWAAVLGCEIFLGKIEHTLLKWFSNSWECLKTTIKN